VTKLTKIPKQLEGQKFIKTIEKRPIEQQWTTKNNYTKDQIGNQKTYGVVCGINNLMVIDCDSKDAENYIMQHPHIKNTFTVKTATKKLKHFYVYVNSHPRTMRFDDQSGSRACDFQGTGTQVIGPGSILKDGSMYEIVNDAPIIEIDYNEVVNYLSKRYKTKNTPKKVVIQEDYIEVDPLIIYIKSKITIQDVLDKYEFNTEGNPGKCPYGHESQGNQCFGYDDETYHCFHCGSKGNIFKLYQDLYNCSFVDAKHELANMAGAPEKIRKQAMQFIASQNKEKMSELICSEFLKNNKVYTIRHDKINEMWIYKNGIYVNNGKTYIIEYTRAILKEFYTTHRCNQIIAKIEADTYIDQEDFFINEDINKIPVQNGILDLFTRKLEPFDSKYKFFNKLGAVYNPDAKAESFEKFQSDIHQTENDVKLNQEFYGYCLYRDYKFEKALMKVGNGRNGKGKDIECLKRLLSPENCVNISLQKLSTDKFCVADLHNKMANLGSDLSGSTLNDTEMFKQLTGHDMVSADRKFLNKIHFQNYAKMIFATNNLPEVPNDKSVGFKDRWVFLEYKNTYKLADEYNRYTPEQIETDNIKLADTNIIDKLTTIEEMSGILNWALDGLDRLFKNKCFTKSSTTEYMENYWQRKSSSADAFIMDELEIKYDDEFFISSQVMKQIYHSYCQKYKIKPEKWKKFQDKIDEFGGIYEKKNRTAVGLGTLWGWSGIKLKHEDLNKYEVKE